jgi:hypothetical protein
MHSINRNATAEARGVPETYQLGRQVYRENSLTARPVQGRRGGRGFDRIECAEPIVLLPWRVGMALLVRARR